jgi:transcriptional regulator GlxA family with amidase domain
MTLTSMKTNETRQRTTTLRDVDVQMNSREAREIRKIEESIGYMMRHLDRPLRVSTLATEVNISPSHFFYLFKRHVGRTPIDYFIRLRLQHACRLLEETEMSVKAIAYTLGYDDPFYFSRLKFYPGNSPIRSGCYGWHSIFTSQQAAAGQQAHVGQPSV